MRRHIVEVKNDFTLRFCCCFIVTLALIFPTKGFFGLGTSIAMLVSTIIAALSVLSCASATARVSTDGSCGNVRGKQVTCLKSSFGSCCSQYGMNRLHTIQEKISTDFNVLQDIADHLLRTALLGANLPLVVVTAYHRLAYA